MLRQNSPLCRAISELEHCSAGLSTTGGFLSLSLMLLSLLLGHNKRGDGGVPAAVSDDGRLQHRGGAEGVWRCGWTGFMDSSHGVLLQHQQGSLAAQGHFPVIYVLSDNFITTFLSKEAVVTAEVRIIFNVVSPSWQHINEQVRNCSLLFAAIWSTSHVEWRR